MKKIVIVGLLLLVGLVESTWGSEFTDTLASAKRMNKYAQCKVAEMYLLGQGVRQSDILAYAWLDIAGKADRDRRLGDLCPYPPDLSDQQKREAEKTKKRIREEIKLGMKTILDKAGAVLNRGDYEQTISDMTLILDQFAYPRAYFYRGIAFFKTGVDFLAIEDFTRSILMQPSSGAYFFRGQAYHKGKKYIKAIKDYNSAIKGKPDYYEAIYYRGSTYAQQGNNTLAIQDFSRVIKAKPGFYQAVMSRGVVYTQQGNYILAIQDFTLIIKARPDYHQPVYYRGLVYSRQGNYTLAIQDFNKTINIKPDFFKAYLLLAKAYVDNHQYQKAIATYLTVIQNDARVIKIYQKSLKEKGFYSGPIDGANTQSFQSAIEACVNAGKVVM